MLKRTALADGRAVPLRKQEDSVGRVQLPAAAVLEEVMAAEARPPRELDVRVNSGSDDDDDDDDA